MRDGSGQRKRTDSMVFDGVLTGVLFVIGVGSMFVYSDLSASYRAGDWLGVLILAVTTAPLLARRRYPVACGLAIAVATLAYMVWDYASLTATAVMLIAVYSAGAYAALLPGIAVTAAHVAVTLVYLGAFFDSLALDGPLGLNAMFSALGFGGVWAIGRSVRGNRIYTIELEDRADRLERTREAEVRAALAEERSRIARELHDVVAHHVSVMTVQATGAQRSLERNPSRSAEVLRSIEATGRAALAEMRRLVGVLHGPARDDQVTDLTTHRGPQPGVADLDDLAAQVRSAGVQVELSIDDDARGLPGGVDVAVFRIVQEALTNTLKHAGPAKADVLVRREADGVRVCVRDDGRGLAADLDGHTPGHGLLGMRERVALYGGTLAAGPRDGGGYQVQARIPLERSAV